MLLHSGSVDSTVNSEQRWFVQDAHLRPCQVDPHFAGERGQRKPEPERNPEKLLRRELTSGEERADDGSSRGDTQADGERAQHPFTVLTNLTTPDVREGFSQRKEKQHSEDRRRCRLVCATDGHLPTHCQRR